MQQYVFFLMLMLIGVVSCAPKHDSKEEDILVSIDKEKLYKGDISRNLPIGSSKKDSIEFAERYIRSWIDEKLIDNIASKNIPNPDKIEESVAEYRRSLIAYEYRKQMILSNESIFNIPKDSIVVYYNINKDKFKLDEPLVKGIFIKIAEDAQKLNEVKKWYKSSKLEDIDKLEKYGLNGAIHYDYFRDRWVAWTDIEKNIPNYFDNPNDFVKTNKSFEISRNGFVYLLNITDYREKGDIMPFDYAESRIKEIFVNSNQRKFDKILKKNLYDEALKSGDMVIYNNKNKN